MTAYIIFRKNRAGHEMAGTAYATTYTRAEQLARAMAAERNGCSAHIFDIHAWKTIADFAALPPLRRRNNPGYSLTEAIPAYEPLPENWESC